ncbi:hypothetical protein ACJJTC_003483 [Scirpophaga incertulas]
MPKRKREDDYDKILKKLKKLEEKLRKRCRSRSKSSDSRSRSKSQERQYNDVTGTLDGSPVQSSAYAGEAYGSHDVEPVEERAFMPSEIVTPAIIPMTGAPASTTVDIGTESAPTVAIAENLDHEMTLDSTILEILGEDPTISNSYGEEIHKDLAVRLEHVVTNGLTKELRKELCEKYLLPNNCKLINAPILNAEIKAAISDLTAKRDKNIEFRQKQIATAISCLSQAINSLISKNNAEPELIKILMDTERILCDSQYRDSVIRRNFILSSLKKDIKDQLQNTKPGNLLFGENLSEAIKAAKAISKSGAELKTPAPKPQPSKKLYAPTPSTSRNNLNWKGPYPTRKQQNPPRTKEPPPPSRNRPSHSSRPSQQQQTRGRR